MVRRSRAARREGNVNIAEPGAQPRHNAAWRPAGTSGTLPAMPRSRHHDEPPGWSLEHWLPVFIFVVLAFVVAGLGVATYREVRSAALMRATDGLERSARELAASFSRNVVVRTAALRAIAADTLIVRSLGAGGAPDARVKARLAEIRTSADSTLLAWQITSPAGVPRFSSDDRWSAADSAELAKTLAAVARTGADQHSVLYRVGSRVHTWTAAPVRARGAIVGVVAELRRRGDNVAADNAVRGLLDEDARMLFTSRGSRDWVSLRGVPVAAPFVSPPVERRAVRVRLNGHGAFAVQSGVATTPWLVVVFQSKDSMLRRPHEFLRKYVIAGAVVLILATLGAWRLSRIVTRPLWLVTDAAGALEKGDYERRAIVSGGGNEIASLATAFNTMADAISKAHVALAERNTQLEQANAQLERASAAKSHFLAMMSHELRTPLNAIGGFTELLEVGVHGPVTPKQVEDLARIRRNKDQLLAIINDILLFTREDAGQLAVKSEPVELAPLLADVTGGLGAQIRARELRLAVSPVPADAIPRGDRAKVHQVLLNLLSNAVKFTDPGGEIAVDTTTSDGEVRIAVRDTGQGIDASKLEAIFEPFTQLDTSLSRRAAGTGLGLSIARKFAAAMGGTVTVVSEPGVGSTFTLALPRADSPEPAPTRPPRQTGERQPA